MQQGVDHLKAMQLLENFGLNEQAEFLQERLQAELTAFDQGENRFMSSVLLKAIETMPDAEQGFQLWKDFYQSGDKVALQKALSRIDISFWGRVSIEAMQMQQLESAKGSGWLARSSTLNQIRSIATTAANASMEVNGMAQDTLCVFSVFEAVAYLAKGTRQESSRLKKALAPKLGEMIEQKLTQDLDTLRAVADKPLLALDEQAKDLLIQEVMPKEKEVLRKLFTDFIHSVEKKPTGRHPLNVSVGFIPADVQFGIELEGYVARKGKFMDQGLELWEESKDAGLRVSQSVNYVTKNLVTPKADPEYKYWQFTRDPSIQVPHSYCDMKDPKLRKHYGGLELVSPILKGPQGGQEMVNFVDLLEKNHFLSNYSCGMHLHVDLSEATLEQRKNLCIALVRNEALIDQLIDPQRRSGDNVFAKSPTANILQLKCARNDHELVELMCPNGDRNQKFDMTNLSKEKAPPTVQYRLEGGRDYMSQVSGFVVVMTNFTKQALDNPNLSLNQVLQQLGQSAIFHNPKVLPNWQHRKAGYRRTMAPGR